MAGLLSTWPAGRLARRSQQLELMDGAGLGDPELQARVLADLARVNRVTRTHAPVLGFLRRAWAALPAGQAVSVLDVGSGQGDLLRAIWRLGQRLQRPLELTGLDLHPDSTRAARAATPPEMAIRYLTADVFAGAPPPADYIVNSQVAHHFSDVQLVALLRWQHGHAQRGWCIADLRRAWLPYLGFRWLARLAGWHPIVRLDGTLSIARACTVAEWQALLAQAGVPAAVQRHLPFRLTVSSVQALAAADAAGAGASGASGAAGATGAAGAASGHAGIEEVDGITADAGNG